MRAAAQPAGRRLASPARRRRAPRLGRGQAGRGTLLGMLAMSRSLWSCFAVISGAGNVFPVGEAGRGAAARPPAVPWPAQPRARRLVRPGRAALPSYQYRRAGEHSRHLAMCALFFCWQWHQHPRSPPHPAPRRSRGQSDSSHTAKAGHRQALPGIATHCHRGVGVPSRCSITRVRSKVRLGWVGLG